MRDRGNAAVKQRAATIGKRAVIWARVTDQGAVKGLMPTLMERETAAWLTGTLNLVSPDTIYLAIDPALVPEWLAHGYRPR